MASAGLVFFICFQIFLHLRGAQGSFCGGDAVPFRLEVLSSGALSLGCAVPSCFGGGEGGARNLQPATSHFDPSDETENQKDGFLRQGDELRSHTRQSRAPAQKAVCENEPSSATCGALNQWIGGIAKGNRIEGPLLLQCCTYGGLAQSTVIGNSLVGKNSAIVGGEVMVNGRQTAFDVITDIKRTFSENGEATIQVTVRRMPCPSDPPEALNEVEPDVESSFSATLEQYGPAGPQAQGALVPNFVPAVVQPQGIVGAVAPNVPAALPELLTCFSADTMVITPFGEKRMDQLRIGDEILSPAHGDQHHFVPVVAFLHRLPEARTKFFEIQTSHGAVVKITAQHLIWAKDKKGDSEGNFILASDVKVGDQLQRTVGNEMLLTRVTNVTIVEEIGAYAPLTSSGLLFANDLFLSCYSVDQLIHLQHSYFYFMHQLKSIIRSVLHYEEVDDGRFVDVPFGTWNLLNILKLIVPYIPFA